jgi:hypothetical protein
MGLHVASVRVQRAIRGHTRHTGSAEEILRAGLEECWSGRYLTASPGTYKQFWTRDTGFAAPSLVRLGGPWPERLLSTLEWAFGVWTTLDRAAQVWNGRRAPRAHVTTTISPVVRWPVDIFDYGVDSLPLLLHAVHALASSGDEPAAVRARGLAHEHAGWIAAEVEHFVDRVVDPSTGLVRSDRHYSAHRDTFRNGSTAYANTMVALLGRTVAETGWGPDLLSRYFAAGGAGEGLGGPDGRDWGLLLRRHFWVGDRFRDRLGSDETSGEANVWPFHTGLVSDDAMLADALDTLRREGYASPYPLRFDVAHRSAGQLWAFRIWSADYQTTTSWTSLGSIYLALLRRVDPAAARVELDRMRALIERDGTFWEVLDGSGRPWRSKSRLSVSDLSMLWGAILLETLESDRAGRTATP